ncbi:MAG TPA: SDR family NAD(P)-dependent oxidoreductase [Ramlibacter sp.]|nr:SDR family NAD(P)-dependent oxidoreductase [Ramlibacter sp.]
MDTQERKVAIITGASGMRGIGRAIALRLARQGLDIALVDIQRDPAQVPQPEIEAGWRGIESVRDEIQALGRRATCIHADIADPAQAQRICARTLQEIGSIDVLVNNARAGIGRDRVPVVELDIAEWDRVMAVNARGTLLLCQAVARHFIAHRVAGRIINMSSLSGKRGMPLHACYSMSKFAVNSLTQVLARELGPHGITVNALCPGWVDTGRFSLGEKLAAEQAATTPEAQHKAALEKQARMNALGRIAVAEDVAGMAAFLISPEAVHITGQAINIDGGEAYA